MYKLHNQNTMSRSHLASHQTAYTFSHAPRDVAIPVFTKTHSFPNALSSTATLSASHSGLPLPYETLSAPTTNRIVEKLGQASKLKADRSKRFLNSKLSYSSIATNGKDTFLTLTSSNSTWGTVCNSITLGFSAPLCRVYYVEIMFQDKLIHDGEELEDFLLQRLGFKSRHDTITGEDLAKWLDLQSKQEFKTVSFEKLQGNCFAVYCITIPSWRSAIPDALALRARTSKKYQILDGFDSVLMLMGRFHNSVWAVFK
ncbi:hypothetical protein DFH27DRAFT_521945 [Peziza echinospora]|nr:hypothetical protein DFH27DRAFT_521945 [Peziza echinospora]